MDSDPKKIYMVTGKGGVGKSAVAGALAMRLAASNLRVLLVEVGETSYFAHVFKKSISEEPTTLQPGLDASRWTGESSLKELFSHLLKIQSLVTLLFDNRVMRALVRVAPALKELAILGKLTSGVRHFGPPIDYDVVILDSFSSGHFLNLLNVPQGMLEVIRRGPMYEQSREIHRTLLDHELTEIIIVTLPEEMPMTEAVELEAELKQRGYSTQVVCNRVLRSPLNPASLQSLSEQNLEKGYSEFINYLSARLDRQSLSLDIYQGPIHRLPLVLSSDSLKVIRDLSEHVGDLCNS
ncbi:MAG: ArsA family ATPase [Bdellovibrionales bacterium]|nr:ArsA family ATPase [Bdellovibrionales bacterium]